MKLISEKKVNERGGPWGRRGGEGVEREKEENHLNLSVFLNLFKSLCIP